MAGDPATAASGEFVVGPSGCGKSALLQALADPEPDFDEGGRQRRQRRRRRRLPEPAVLGVHERITAALGR